MLSNMFFKGLTYNTYKLVLQWMKLQRKETTFTVTITTNIAGNVRFVITICCFKNRKLRTILEFRTILMQK